MSDRPSLLSARNIKKSYRRGSQDLQILDGVNLEVTAGEGLCIVGASGAGKSTLLHLLGTLDRPSEGEVIYKGQDLFAMGDEKLASFRSRHMGFVFQFHHLLPEFSAIENIMMPCCIAGDSQGQAREKSVQLLKRFGLYDRRDHFPSEMSGGEQQRVAIARAVANRPEILLADEPTGNLDSQNSLSIQELFFELQAQLGVTLIVVTHDRSYASKFERRLEMTDGDLRPLAEF